MIVEGEDDTPPATSVTGSIGDQKVASPAQVNAVVGNRARSNDGLSQVTTAEQLTELARSSEPADVKRDIVVGILVGTQQAQQADLQLRLQQAEKDLSKVRRHLADVQGENSQLAGDVRVRDERITHLEGHRTRDNVLLSVASICFAVGGAFIGRSLPTAVLGFAVGAALSLLVWFKGHGGMK